MSMLSLNDIKLYEELQERKTTNSKLYCGFLISIASDMNIFLQYIRKQFPEFPDHDLQHSLRLLNYLSGILTNEEVNNLSDTEIFVLFLAAFFHDAGMSLYGNKDIEKIRRVHHEYANIVIDSYFDEYLKILRNANRYKNVVKFACKSHGLTIKELYGGSDFKKCDRIEGDKVRYSLLAILIRIGDLMDLEADRVNPFVLASFGHMFPQISLEHNQRHLNVTYYNYSSCEISIEVNADNVDQYCIWQSWLNYLREEILQANTELNSYKFYFPFPETIIHTNGDYDVTDLRFEIDDKGGIWKIISQSIYTDEKDFIRELIQNAIDASLVSIYEDSKISLQHKSPRSWNSKKYCKDIFVGYSEHRNQLLVIDSGVGMNEEDLRRFLFKISGSGYVDIKERNFNFPGIANFGIGFVSCLINATNIDIYTKKKEEPGCKVILNEGTNLAFLQKCEFENYHGTCVAMILKQHFTFSTIRNYIEETFHFPSVGIQCVDIDELETISDLLGIGGRFHEIADKAYLYPTYYDYLNKVSTEKRQKFDLCLKELRALSEETENLISWIKENQEIDTKISDTEKFKKFRVKVNVLSKNGQKWRKKVGHSFPLNINQINESDLFIEHEKYISLLETYAKNVLKAHKKYYDISLKYTLHAINVSSSRRLHHLYKEDGWRYLIILLDDDLKVKDIKMRSQPLNLCNEKGILFIKKEHEDYDNGIEFEAINGFLFANGVICNTIARFKRVVEQKKMKYVDDYITFGSERSLRYVRDDLEEDYFNRLDDPSADNYYIYDEGEYKLDLSYEAIFEAIYLENNRFVYRDDLNLSELEAGTSKRDVPDYLHWDNANLPIDALASRWMDDAKNAPFLIEQFKRIIQGNSFEYFQDGIKIPCDLSSIIPIGFFKVRCNCTADARMILNVTRHKPSELGQDVQRWCNDIGYIIQSKLVDGTIKAINKCGLSINSKKIQKRDIGDDIFSAHNEKQFYQIISKRT